MKSVNSNNSNNNECVHKKHVCLSSLDHVTPKSWKSYSDDISNKLVINPINFSKSVIAKQWKPAPRLQISPNQNGKKNQLASSIKPDQKSPCTNEERSGASGSSNFKISQNYKYNETDQSNKPIMIQNEGADSSSVASEFKSEILNRPSICQDSKAPGFGTIKRMWDKKCNPSSSVTDQMLVNENETTGAWHHVKKPIKTSVVQKQNLLSIDCLSPKPFQMVSSVNDHSVFSDISKAQEFDDGSLASSKSAVSFTCHKECIPAALKIENDSKVTSAMPNTAIAKNKFFELNSINVSDIEIGIYGGLEHADAHAIPSELHQDVEIYNGVESDDDKELCVIANDSPPPVQLHEPLHISFSQIVQPSSDENYEIPNYLPMSNREMRYVDMVNNSKTLEIKNFQEVVPPPPPFQTKSKREYHEIDSEVPPPPDREPPKLPQHSFSYVDESFEGDPPPLPPDNAFGRRSMSYSKEKGLQIVYDVQKNINNQAYDLKNKKKIKYVEVDITSYDDKRRETSKQYKTAYTDVLVVSDKDQIHTVENVHPSGLHKKHMNVKQKLQSMFSKDEVKTAQSKDKHEPTVDFEKERNKMKRISGRFYRKKHKDVNKIKKSISHDEINSPGFDSAELDPDVSTSRPSSDIIPSNSSSTYSSGDGEVRNQNIATSPDSDVNHSLKMNDVSMLPSQSAKIDKQATQKKQSAKHYNNNKPQGQLYDKRQESTFLAYPPLHHAIEDNGDNHLKVASFLHNYALNDQLNSAASPSICSFDKSKIDVRSSIPPPIPPHKRLSAPTLSSVEETIPQQPRFSSTNLKAAFSGLADSSKIETKPTESPLVPRYLRNSNDVKSEALTNDNHDNSSDENYINASINEKNIDNLYIPANDCPIASEGYDQAPRIPERDESIYESIPASFVVPPSPFKREPSYSFLDSEPLYQDYRRLTISHASSKRRKAEGFKREKALSQPVTSSPQWESELMSEDMGTTTLWRSIPEVVMKDLPAVMSPEELKLQQSQFEVLTSEASYLRSLNILYNHFMNDRAMLNPQILPSADRRHLFSKIEQVRTVEQQFLRELEQHFWADLKLSKVCDMVIQYAKTEFKVYIIYIQNQVYQDRILTRLQRTNDRFAEELCRLESSPECNRLSLLSFLLLPMQRVTRLPLLVQAIMNSADAAGDVEIFKSAKQALGIVNKLVKTCNESARKMQQTEQLAEIASQLDYSPNVKMYALISQSRSLVKKGELNVLISAESRKASKTAKLWLFLFSDVLIIAKKKSLMDFALTPRYEVIDWAARQYLVVNENALTENAIYLVILENQAGKRIEMSLMPSSQNELSRWETALNPSAFGPAGESVYEIWDCPQYMCVAPYTAQQPDELTIEVGDVLQVLKKTSDGWLEGELMRDQNSGWFPADHCEEIQDEHVRARNMRNLYRTFTGS